MERVGLDPGSPWWGEHRSRYRFARPRAVGARVLDIACGSGFGVEMLIEAGARCVVGVDLELEAVAAAGRAFGGPGRIFLAADGTHLPFRDASFNLVTSFETLEHVPDAKAFVAELRRVLSPEGLIILSTPNRAFTEMNGRRCENPFHVREYTRDELAQLLAVRFGAVELRGQRLSSAYRMSPFEADHQRMKPDLLKRLDLAWWKAQNKLPFPVKDRLSRLVARHPFYPGEEHYLFENDPTGRAPVLIALCRP